MKTLSRLGGALAMAAGAALTLGSGVASAQMVNFQGSTDGCFGIACTPVSGSTTLLGSGLTYTDSSFNVTTAGGSAGISPTALLPNNNLGTFSLTGVPFSFEGSVFRMLVTFSAPAGSVPGSGVASADLSLSVGTTQNGGVFINFQDAPLVFSYGSGNTFRFFVDDLSLSVSATGVPVPVTGRITTQVSAIPEPETYALMMAGLAAVGFMSRRRKKA